MESPANKHLTKGDPEPLLLRSDTLRADPTLLAATGCTDLKRAQKSLELLASGPLTREEWRERHDQSPEYYRRAWEYLLRRAVGAGRARD